jgi:hypothetical protein
VNGPRKSFRRSLTAFGLLSGSHPAREQQPDRLAPPVGVRLAVDELIAVARTFAWITDPFTKAAPTHRGADVHGRLSGHVLTQAMLMLAAGGESCADIEALRAQDRPFGHVPSDSTVYRTFRQIDPGTLGRRTRPAKRSPACCGRATPGSAASPIISRTKSRGRRHKSRLVRAGEG